ncbi:MAG TPA: DUF4129 domain-containing protein [Sphingobium sp.]|uniref:DUF4129 domain-containing protein n=1 Tax=Sphingobium sp. TaxID=1912891 RepID=UPI002ED370E9
MSGVEGASDERLLAAHRALRDGGDLQFDLVPAPGPPKAPAWLRALGEWLDEALKPVGRFLNWIGSLMPDAPYARIFLWGVGIALVCLIVWIVQDRIRHGVWRLPRVSRRRFAASGMASAEEEAWQPEAAAARGWLQEADALAAQGHYAQAVHRLLLRSIEDLNRRRPHLVRPALTSRDLADAWAIPPAPRRLFADIAGVVERSLFGGRDVDADQWASCRAAYADFVQARSWKA